MRVAEHAYDKSFVRMFVAAPGGGNVSISFGAKLPGDGLDVLVHPEGGACGGGAGNNCSDLAVVFMDDFAWARSGTVAGPAGPAPHASTAGTSDLTHDSGSVRAAHGDAVRHVTARCSARGKPSGSRRRRQET